MNTTNQFKTAGKVGIGTGNPTAGSMTIVDVDASSNPLNSSSNVEVIVCPYAANPPLYAANSDKPLTIMAELTEIRPRWVAGLSTNSPGMPMRRRTPLPVLRSEVRTPCRRPAPAAARTLVRRTMLEFHPRRLSRSLSILVMRVSTITTISQFWDTAPDVPAPSFSQLTLWNRPSVHADLGSSERREYRRLRHDQYLAHKRQRLLHQLAADSDGSDNRNSTDGDNWKYEVGCRKPKHDR